MKKSIIWGFILIIFISDFFSGAFAAGKIKIGTELDAFPYLTGGYYGSLVVGYENYRIRGILARSFPPEFVTPEGFSGYELEVYAVVGDYFLGKRATEQEGFWIGIGLEHWKTTVINQSDSQTGNFENTIFTLGGGYVWRFYKNFYLNPWVAGHLKISGPANQPIGNNKFKVPRFMPEASLKLGFYF